MGETLNLIKLSVGSESIEQLIDWQCRRSQQIEDGLYYHVTRMWPKRAGELLDGGSIYWVIKGMVQARQRILGFREIDRGDGIARCGIVLDPHMVRTRAMTKRPFQGWRYLPGADAPTDLAPRREGEADLPPGLLAALSDIGVR